jgi:hypothetical protein
MEHLALLEEWYSSQCNGRWEHQYGISVETLDNPGWTLKIDLYGTGADGRTLARVTSERSENDWLQYWVDGNQFQAHMGTRNLREGIQAFLTWVEKRD